MSLRWLIVAAIVALAGSGWVWFNRVPAEVVAAQRVAAPALNHPAPSFSVETVTGETFSTDDLAGMPMVVNFWATWCGPCRREMPALENAANRYADRVAFVGIDQGEAAATVRAFAREVGVTFPLGLDLKQTVGAELFNVRGMPTTFFVDGDGIIRRIWMGEMNSITLEEGIAEILR